MKQANEESPKGSSPFSKELILEILKAVQTYNGKTNLANKYRATIARRLSEGKDSPVASSQLENLEAVDAYLPQQISINFMPYEFEALADQIIAEVSK